MSWFSDIFSNSLGEVVDGVGGIIDDLHTSDEEKAEAKAKILQITNAHSEKVMNAEVQIEKEVTTRHANDMKSDSWLSKNIRPLGLIFAMLNLWLLAWATIFLLENETQITLAQAWIPLLVALVGTMVGFYYSWRGGEKIAKIKSGK
jgi:hypothetical protein